MVSEKTPYQPVVDTEEVLCAEFKAWCAANNLPHISASEYLHDDALTSEQRKYIEQFCERWYAWEESHSSAMQAALQDVAASDGKVLPINQDHLEKETFTRAEIEAATAAGKEECKIQALHILEALGQMPNQVYDDMIAFQTERDRLRIEVDRIAGNACQAETALLAEKTRSRELLEALESIRLTLVTANGANCGEYMRAEYVPVIVAATTKATVQS